MSDRKATGEAIDEKNIRKHKNDIFRLVTMLSESDTFVLPVDMQRDMEVFCQTVSKSLPDSVFFKEIGAPAKPENVFELLCASFKVNIQNELIG